MQKILIVDDVPANIKILRELLVGNYQLYVATNGKMAVEVAETRLPDLILMDVMMPEVDGITACGILRSRSQTAGIPVIFITAKSEVDDMVRGFEAGGVDYVTKPFNPSELNARVKTHLELKRTREQLQLRNEQLNDANEKLHVAAMTDPLTELRNRRYMTMKIDEEMARVTRSQRVFSLILVDIDHFKKVNDQYGHECGDQVLKQVSEALRAGIREQDHLARWGGEEFLILLPETDVHGAMLVAERLRENTEETQVVCQKHEIKVTATFGVTEYDQSGNMDNSIREADNALYLGKKRGRNRVTAL
ncbi:MAG: diguanylate cyclase [Firmicutes bacterium]|nr:diguanylate cyclase [Bacillota bacterium]